MLGLALGQGFGTDQGPLEVEVLGSILNDRDLHYQGRPTPIIRMTCSSIQLSPSCNNEQNPRWFELSDRKMGLLAVLPGCFSGPRGCRKEQKNQAHKTSFGSGHGRGMRRYEAWMGRQARWVSRAVKASYPRSASGTAPQDVSPGWLAGEMTRPVPAAG